MAMSLRCPTSQGAARLQAPHQRPRCLVGTRALTIPGDYGYVVGSVALTGGILQWMAIRVALARRDSGITYPKMYADGDDEASMKFNCTQRAHQNSLEYAPAFLAMLCLTGLVFPIYAATLGTAWNVGRVLYANGYSTGDPKNRMPGAAISNLAYLVLIFSTLYAGLKMANLLPF